MCLNAAAKVSFADAAVSEITPPLQLFLLENDTSLLALSLIGYNALQLPGELSPLPGMVIIRACSDDKPNVRTLY